MLCFPGRSWLLWLWFLSPRKLRDRNCLQRQRVAGAPIRERRQYLGAAVVEQACRRELLTLSERDRNAGWSNSQRSECGVGNGQVDGPGRDGSKDSSDCRGTGGHPTHHAVGA